MLVIILLQYIQNPFTHYKMKVYCLIILIVAQILAQDLPWVKPQDLNRGLPSSVSLYTLKADSSPFNNSKLTGAYAKFNMNDSNLEFVVKDTNGDALGYFPKTPIDYAAAQENVVYAVINGGYFDMAKNVSASFLAEKGKVRSANTVNFAKNIFPTVGAFGLNSQGKFQTEFIYSYGDDFDTYKYQVPNHYPGPAPIQADGVHWEVNQGIGAGPILLKNTFIMGGNLQHFNQANMIDFRHPRSAICIDSLNNLYLVAIDGRYAESDGLTVNELAELMQRLNCLDAMNLDGGGSTLLYANNKILNRPSDATGPRKVVSAVLVRDRYKKKVSLSTQ